MAWISPAGCIDGTQFYPERSSPKNHRLHSHHVLARDLDWCGSARPQGPGQGRGVRPRPAGHQACMSSPVRGRTDHVHQQRVHIGRRSWPRVTVLAAYTPRAPRCSAPRRPNPESPARHRSRTGRTTNDCGPPRQAALTEGEKILRKGNRILGRNRKVAEDPRSHADVLRMRWAARR
jgi:hypothetical protein